MQMFHEKCCARTQNVGNFVGKSSLVSKEAFQVAKVEGFEWI